MNILIFCHVSNDGGISSKTCEMAYFLHKAGHTVRTVYFKQLPTHYLLKRTAHVMFKRVNPLTLGKETREFEPDVVVCAYSSYLGLAMKLKDIKVPVVPIVHGQGVRFYRHRPAKRKVLKKMAGRILRSFPAVIVLNNDLKASLMELGVKQERIHIVPNGVDLERFKPQRKKKEFDLVFAGSLYREKRLDVLFEALRSDDLGMKSSPSLLILGTGPMMSTWKQMARKTGVKVRFAGHRKDIWNHYPRGRVFVLCSDSEEFPSAPLEAMACGLPVVATKVGSLPHVVKNGRSGILVKPNDPDALAEAIDVLLEDAGMRQTFGVKGRESVEKRYGWEYVIRSYEAVFKGVVKKSD